MNAVGIRFSWRPLVVSNNVGIVGSNTVATVDVVRFWQGPSGAGNKVSVVWFWWKPLVVGSNIGVVGLQQ